MTTTQNRSPPAFFPFAVHGPQLGKQPFVRLLVFRISRIVQNAHQAFLDGKMDAGILIESIQDALRGLYRAALLYGLVNFIQQSHQYLMLVIDFLDAGA